MDLGGTWTLRQTPIISPQEATTAPPPTTNTTTNSTTTTTTTTNTNASPSELVECPAIVPGEVHCALLKAGIIDDPYIGYRELQYRWVALSDWEFSRTFDVDAKLLDHQRVELTCSSIDTIGTILINGNEVGKTENMFREYSFDIKSSLQAGSNTIFVKIQSAAKYAKEAASASSEQGKTYPLWEYPQGEHHRNHIRKCGCHFGWDWGPCFVPSGIVGPIKITATSIPTITHVTTTQHWHKVPDGPVDLTINIHLLHPTTANTSTSMPASKYELTVHFEDQLLSSTSPPAIPEKKRTATKEVVSLTHQIATPKVWWPNGSGAQPLSDLRVTVLAAGGAAKSASTEKNVWQGKVGLRHLELDTGKDDLGEKFQFVVNGKPIFAKGADWIPADSFQTRITPARVRSLLQSAKDANFNMLRVWGGGVYESDLFYDDMMFACALYPATPQFLKNVKEEVKYQVRRLAIHPSIALWCGNNENEEAMAMWEESKNSRDKFVVDYHMLYIETIMPAVLKEDTTRKYWPSSPSNGVGVWGNSQDSTRGDTHYWGVWHSNKPFTEYLTVKSRFCSEFGFQSLPRLSALRRILPVINAAAAALAGVDEGEFLNLSAPFLEYKQRSPTPGNKGLLSHVATHFRVPKTFELFVYLSQVLQAVSIKTACEHFRRQMPTCMGSLYWQLNDIWEGPSWSSLEYDGSWKLLHNMAVHFYAPVLVSAVENGENMDIWVTNDGGAIEGFLNVDCWRWDATEQSHAPRILRHVQCKEESSTCVWSIPIQTLLSSVRAERMEAFLVLKLVVKGIAYRNLHFFTPLKAVTLPVAHITYEIAPYIPPTTTTTPPPLNKQPSLLRSLPAPISPTAASIPPMVILQPCLPRYEVTLRSDRVTPYIYLQSGKYRGNFADNGFLLLPGEERKIQFSPLEGDPLPELSLFQKEFALCSLRDSY